MLFSRQCYAPGEQFADPVYRPVGYDVKDIAEVAFWLHSVQFARPDQAVQQRSPLSSMIRTEEQVDGMTFIYSLEHWWDIPEEVIMHSENIAAYIGLDVHKETLAVAIAAPERLGEVRYYGTINNEAQAVRRLFQKLQGLYGNILSCYEAGPCGFGLYHQLTAMNIKCQVIAPSRIPKSPTDRIKNDHRDEPPRVSWRVFYL